MIKQYTITVNGTAYDVTVEEKTGASTNQAANHQPIKPAAPISIPSKSQTDTTTAGNIEVKTGASGKIVNIPTKIGQSVKKCDAVIMMEAMKMEIAVTAPEDGIVASIDVEVGDMVETGSVLATLN